MNQPFKHISYCIAVFILFAQCTTEKKQAHTPKQDYDNQVLDRIDRIYFTRSGLTCKTAALVTGSKGASEVTLNADWPSDHWAVLAEFELN